MTASLLAPILEDVRRRAAERRVRMPLSALRAEVGADGTRRERVLTALRGPGMAFIAECKRRSPSAGAIADERDPAARARLYVRGGAAAVSVLTEQDHFGGSLDDLSAVSATGVPTLRKDFVLDEAMVLESAHHGACAVLLLAAVLDDGRLSELHELALSIGLAPLVEIHTESELDRVLALRPAPVLVGVNARDLTDFHIDPSAATLLLPHLPPGVVRVAESGLHTLDDVRRVRAAGADAALVGEALMRAPDPVATLTSWREATLA